MGRDRSAYLRLVERKYLRITLMIIQGEKFPPKLFCFAGFFSETFSRSLWSERIPDSGQASLETSENWLMGFTTQNLRGAGRGSRYSKIRLRASGESQYRSPAVQLGMPVET